MTRYTVVWLESAQDELAELWTRAPDRNAVTSAAHVIDVELSQDAPTKGVDLAEGQIDVVGAASDLGRKFNAPVTLVHAIPAAEHVAGDTGGDEFGRFLIHAAKEHIERLQSAAGTKFEARVEPGGVAKAIRSVALEKNADLVIIGRGVAQAPFGRLRSKAYEIIRESPCPVLSL